MNNNDISKTLLEHYHNEWLHRHSHFWKILSSVYITNLIIICFPLCCSYFNIEIDKIEIDAKIFPIIGIIFSLFCLYLLFLESQKIIKLRKNINYQLSVLDENYTSKKNTAFSKFFATHINFIITFLLSFIMILIAIYVLFMF